MTTDRPLAYRFVDGTGPVRVPFDLNANKPYVSVRVNGGGPYAFLLDTGSVSMALDTEVAAALGLALGAQFESSGAGEGTIQGATGAGVTLGLDGLECASGPIDVLPLSQALAAAEGRRVDGLLGYPFLATFVVTLDYAGGQMTVAAPRAPGAASGAPGAVLPFALVRGHPFVSATLTTRAGTRVAGRFLVDTGWRSPLSLNAPLVAAHRLLDSTPAVDAVTGVGVGGPSVEAVGRVARLDLGPVVIRDPVTNFSRARAGILAQDDMAGIIGGDVLRRFTVTFDYPAGQIILQPNAHVAEPYEFDLCGMMVLAEGAQLTTFRVYHVVAGGPAAAAGVREGDTITAIDGHATDGMVLEQIRRLFRQDAGATHTLAIRRDAQMSEATVQLHRLV